MRILVVDDEPDVVEIITVAFRLHRPSYEVLPAFDGKSALARLESFGATVRQALLHTPRFHDGCWLYLRLTDPLTCQQDVQDIEQLILIKKKPPRKK